MVEVEWWVWVAFIAVILSLLCFDLLVLNRKAHVVSTREAGLWTAGWVTLGLAFAVLLWVWQGSEPSLAYITGYLVEYSLSVDNVFVFALIFTYFAVAPEYQHRVLFWGIVGAMVFRGIFIFAGVALLQNFHWMFYILGAFLVYTGIKLARNSGIEVEPGENPVLRLLRRLVPLTEEYHGQRFFVRHAGKLMATPMLAVLVVVETTDVVFAVDSVPAILGITLDPFIVFTSNVFAILGLRALYFLLAGMIRALDYLSMGLGIILALVGLKMLSKDLLEMWFHYELPTVLSLGVIALVLIAAVAASLLLPPREKPEAEPEPAAPPQPSPTGADGTSS
jgi:tellurite resistance protein TerC